MTKRAAGKNILLLSLFFVGVFSIMVAGQNKPMPGMKTPPQWKLGLQAWTFNRFSLFETIDKVQSLNLRYLEAYPNQRLSPENPDPFSHTAPLSVLAQAKIRLDRAGIRLVNYGVVGLGMDEAENRKVFDFAKVMGIETIVSEPEPGSLPLIDRLCGEYGIHLAVHNHPKDSRYWNPDAVLQAVQGCSAWIGACADTGHWMRSGVDPLEALKKLEGRILCLHFKDLNQRSREGHDVPWGTGEGNARALLMELNRQNFSGVFSIEYEHNWENSLPEVARCVEFFQAVSEDLSKD